MINLKIHKNQFREEYILKLSRESIIVLEKWYRVTVWSQAEDSLLTMTLTSKQYIRRLEDL